MAVSLSERLLHRGAGDWQRAGSPSPQSCSCCTTARVWHRDAPCHASPRGTMTCLGGLCRATPCGTVPQHVGPWCAMLCHAHHVAPRQMGACHTTWHHTTPRGTVPRHTTPRGTCSKHRARCFCWDLSSLVPRVRAAGTSPEPLPTLPPQAVGRDAGHGDPCPRAPAHDDTRAWPDLRGQPFGGSGLFPTCQGLLPHVNPRGLEVRQVMVTGDFAGSGDI